MTLKKLSANIPRDLLTEACRVSKLNQTEALVSGLRELIATHKRQQFLKAKGKFDIRLNIEKFRERNRL